MDKILERHDDVGVVATVVYSNGDKNAYKDKDCTTLLTKKELHEAFIKGTVIIDTAQDEICVYKPIGYQDFATTSGDGIDGYMFYRINRITNNSGSMVINNDNAAYLKSETEYYNVE